jgi:hypothetical protein
MDRYANTMKESDKTIVIERNKKDWKIYQGTKGELSIYDIERRARIVSERKREKQ